VNDGLSSKFALGLGTTDSVLFVTTHSGVYSSLDMGATWRIVGDGIKAHAITTFASIGNTLLAAGVDGLFRTTDAGATWARSGIDFAIYKPLTAIDSVFYALTAQSIFRSTDLGLSWQPLSPDVKNLAARTLVGIGGVLYAATDNGVLRSADNGATWSKFNNGLTDIRVWSLAVHNGALYAGTYGNGVFKMPLTELGVRGTRNESHGISLSDIIPNPATASATMRYTLAGAGVVKIALFDAMGRAVRTLRSGAEQAGEHEIAIDASGLPTGVYYCRLQSGGSVLARPMVVER
jgi:photosystem II stability/assembly factor-like uncharacterized protein